MSDETVRIIIQGQDSATPVVRGVAGELDKLSRSFKPEAILSGMADIGRKVALISGGALVAGIGLAAKTAIDLNASLEQTRISFTALLGSEEKATTQMNELWQYAAVTPFEFPTVVQAAKTLLGFGTTAENLMPTVKALGNVVAGLGLGNESLQRLSLSLGQITSAGKVMGPELREMALQGVSFTEILAVMSEQTGTSTDDLLKMKEAGTMTATMFMDAFRAWSDQKFGDATAKQAKTFTGAMSTIKDSLQMTAAQGFQPIFDAMSQMAQQAATTDLSGLTSTLQEASRGALAMIGTLTSFISSNTIPVLASLAAVILSVVGLAFAAWAIAAAPVLLLLAAIAAGVFLLTKNMQDNHAAAVQQAIDLAAYKSAMGESTQKTDEYTRIYERLKAVQAGFIYLPPVARAAEIKSLTKQLAALDAQVDKTAQTWPTLTKAQVDGMRALRQAQIDALNKPLPITMPTFAAPLSTGEEPWANLDSTDMRKWNEDLQGYYADTAKAAWDAAGQAFLSGMGGLKTALDDLNKPQGAQPYDALDFEKKQNDIDKLKAKLPELQEQLARIQGTSTAKEFNWRMPDPTEIAQLQAEIKDTRLQIAGYEQDMGKMSTSNDTFANSGVTAIQKVRDAFKLMVGDQITNLQMSGTISDEQAAAWRKATGVTQTDEEAVTLNMTRLFEQAKKDGPATQQFVTTAIAEVMGTFDGKTASLAKTLSGYWDVLTGKAKDYGKTVVGLPGVSGAVNPPMAATPENISTGALTGVIGGEEIPGSRPLTAAIDSTATMQQDIQAINATTIKPKLDTSEVDAGETKLRNILGYMTDLASQLFHAHLVVDITPPPPPPPPPTDQGGNYASGINAIFHRATRITVGEAGPEHVAVTPLSQGGTRGAAQGQDISIVVNNPTPEPASMSILRRLRTESMLGAGWSPTGSA